VSTVLYVATFWTIASTSGLPGHVGAGEWGELALLALRGVVLALVATAAGFGLATLGRHTAAALGVVAGYAVIWEIGGRIVMEVIESPKPDIAMFSTYLGAWMAGRLGFSDRYNGWYEIFWWHSALVFAGVLALFVGGAFATFRRRDLA
jgi:ABC-2 type transport system permease protein